MRGERKDLTPGAAGPRVAVVGTLAVDQTVRVARLPRPGETVSSSTHEASPGGKGMNCGVAARRLGARVLLGGRVGDDAAGRLLRETLAREGIDGACVETDPARPTALSVIAVDDAGDNQILTLRGAAARFEGLAFAAALADPPDALVCQVEFDPAVACRLVAAARTRVVLAVAPYRRLPAPLLAAADTLVVNEAECRAFLGAMPRTAAGVVRALGEAVRPAPPCLVVTLGARGALAVEGGAVSHAPALDVPVVDTTGAGDAFVAGYAVALARGEPRRGALLFALAVAGLSVQGPGAQGGLPDLPAALAERAAGAPAARSLSPEEELP